MTMGTLLASVVLLLLFYKIKNNLMYTDNVTQGTELVFALVVHRHGDRTPTPGDAVWSLDKEALYQAIKPYGFGQLTNAGKRRGYEIGKFIRERYDSLLSQTYNESEIYIRSTDIARSKMTVLTAMAAVYPAKSSRWSYDINWEPVPYTTVPLNYDFNIAVANCIKVRNTWMKRSLSREVNFRTKYKESMDILSDIYKQNITYPYQILSIYQLYESMISLNLKFPPKITKTVLEEIFAASGDAINIVVAHENIIALQAGVLLNEFFESALQIIEGNATQKVRILSGHDFNVLTLQAVTEVPHKGPFKYGATYALELRKVIETGKYVVLPVYLPTPEEDPVYLQVKGCDQVCDFNRFHFITSKHILTEKEWRVKCGVTFDTELDPVMSEHTGF